MKMSALPQLTDHKYLIFDVYGTLVDWETAIYDGLRPLLSRFPSASQWSRREALTAFASIEIDLQVQEPTLRYSDLLAKTYRVLERRLAAAEGKADITHAEVVDSTVSAEPTAALDASVVFGRAIKYWTPFLDSAEALKALSSHFKLIVLSNVDRTSFEYTHEYLSEGIPPPTNVDEPSQIYSRPTPNTNSRNLWLPRKIPGSKSPFSLVLTAQDVGAYKPSPDGFNKVLEIICTEPSLSGVPEDSVLPTIEEIKTRTLIVAQSIFHDITPAKGLGMRSVWIDRPGAVYRPDDGGLDAGWTWRFETLGDMVKAVEEELKERQ